MKQIIFLCLISFLFSGCGKVINRLSGAGDGQEVNFDQTPYNQTFVGSIDSSDQMISISLSYEPQDIIARWCLLQSYPNGMSEIPTFGSIQSIPTPHAIVNVKGKDAVVVYKNVSSGRYSITFVPKEN